MAVHEEGITILNIDKAHDGIIVTFSDNTTILFPTSFLYAARNINGNTQLPDVPAPMQ